VKKATCATVVCAFLILVCLRSSICGAESSDWAVRTLAGSGLSGFDDGPAGRAAFVMPMGLALEKDGSIVVADAGAQRVRRIKDGKVATIAGGGGLEPNGLWVIGGYHDGAGADARFNQPGGVAVRADGAIFVADYGNHCIREIANGLVTTFAGAPGRPGNADGPLASATFSFPRALAFGSDADG